MSQSEAIQQIERRVDQLLAALREGERRDHPTGHGTTLQHDRISHLEWEVAAMRRALALTMALQVSGLIRSDASSAAIDSAFDDLERRLS